MPDSRGIFQTSFSPALDYLDWYIGHIGHKNSDLVLAKTRAGVTKSSSSAKNDMQLIFLLDNRFCHPKYTPKNQSEGVYRDKKKFTRPCPFVFVTSLRCWW